MRGRHNIQGIVEDIAYLLQPKDAMGNIQPLTTIDIGLSTSAVIKIAALVAGAVILSKLISK